MQEILLNYGKIHGRSNCGEMISFKSIFFALMITIIKFRWLDSNKIEVFYSMLVYKKIRSP
jgi:hypothetical protein